jgi:hypothetical protein
MAEKFWIDDPVAQPQQSGPVVIPNAAGIAADQRDQTRTDIAVEGNDRSGRQEGRETAKDERDGVAKMRDAFLALPEVKKYNTIVSQADAALHTDATPAGDQRLMYSIVQMRDPLGSVREGDAALLESGVPYMEQQLQKLRKNLNAEGMFPDEYRKQLKQEAVSNLNTANRAYTQNRRFYTDIANRSGYDPYLVVGPHAGSPYLERFREYDKANGLGEFAPGRDSQRTAIPGATADNLAFDIDTGAGAFGSQIEANRLTPQQQGALDAYLNANAGNPNFGPEQLSAFYQSMGIEGGAMAADDQFFEAVRKGEAFGTQPNYEQADEARRKWAEDQVQQQLGNADIGGTVALQNGMLPWTDELMGFRGGITNLVTGDGSFAEGYRDGRDIERAAVRMAEDEHGIAPRLVGSLLTPAGIVSKTNLARDAMVVGGAYGAGAGEGFSDTVAKTATGAGLGYAAGKGLEAAAPVISRFASPILDRAKNAIAKPGQREFVDAAERQGLDYMAADIPGATTSRMATSVSKMTLGGIPIAERAKKIIDAAAAKKTEIARSLSPANDVQQGGQAIKRGTSEWSGATKDRSGAMHDAIPIPKDRPAVTGNTNDALADINAGLSSNQSLSEMIADPTMQAYQRALENGGLSWADMKKFRSYIGEQAGKPSVSQTMSKADLKKLYAGLSEDMRATATAEGPKALKAFERANDFTRGMERRREEVLTSLLGKNYDKSDEQAFNQIMNWSRKDTGDWMKLGRAMRSLPENEANSVRAVVIDRLGMARKGGQDAGGEVFSPSEFMTQWNGLDKRAKSILFQGEQRKAMDDLATYFDGLKGASQDFANTSRTGLATNALATAGTFGIDIVTGALASIGQLGAGKFLSSPTFAKWLAGLAKKPNPAAMVSHIERLSGVARAEPLIANDILTLQQRLADAFAQPQSLRAAAEENDEIGDAKVRERKRDDAQ